MKQTEYRSLHDLNDQQEKVMSFIISWVNEKKTPVPKKEIVKEMTLKGMKPSVIEWSLDVLLSKSYIRRGYTEKYNTTVYVQTRGMYSKGGE